MDQKLKIGVIGLGKMGKAIAGRISESEFAVFGWTRSGLSDEDAAKLNISSVHSLDELAAASDIIILSLLDDEAVISVLQALCVHDLSGKLIVDTSTVSPSILLGQMDRIRAANCSAIDAPISGWPVMVANGTAGLYIGGQSEDVSRFMPVAKVISNRIHHVGDLSQGAATKIVNNMMLAGYWQCLKEALQVGQSAGLSPETLLEILTNSPAANGTLAAKVPVILGESQAVSFTTSGIAKDTQLFKRVAEEASIDTPVLDSALASFQNHCDAGFGEADFVSMVHAALTVEKVTS
ncbi:MAG: hydroxyacid dehydrogenase [Blastopirellula sp.]|nr:MAG: hydroxyacid dehydrogenase [Blastopirellula sp.]